MTPADENAPIGLQRGNARRHACLKTTVSAADESSARARALSRAIDFAAALHRKPYYTVCHFDV